MIMLILASIICIIVHCALYMCIGFIVYVLIHILGQLLVQVQLAALLSCHAYCNSVPAAVCA